MIQKFVNAKTKTNLKSNTIVWDINFYFHKNLYFFYIITLKVQIQDITNKNSYFKKFKVKKLKPVS